MEYTSNSYLRQVMFCVIQPVAVQNYEEEKQKGLHFYDFQIFL